MAKPKRVSNPSAAFGFTLLEVLIALAVIASALIALVASAGTHVRTQSNLYEHQLASWVLDNALAELKMRESWPEIGRREGAESMAGIRFVWRAEIQSTVMPELRRVDFEVRLADQTGASLQSGRRPALNNAPVTSRTAFFGNR